MRRITAFLALLLLASCQSSEDDGVVDVALVGETNSLFETGLRLAYASQNLRSATAQGLVRLDEEGNVVPAIAERWIVTDDGQSYIFRIREFDLANGKHMSASDVGESLRSTVSKLKNTSLGFDLARIRDIRAMTGRVIEIRLKSPMPDLLQLLAQPEMGVRLGDAATGPMAMVRDGAAAVLNALPPERRGLPSQPEWGEGIREIRVSAVPARAAIKGFGSGVYDVVLGGRLPNLPVASSAPLSRGTVRLDSAIGLFGLDVVRAKGFLAQADNREALAMTLDRPALLEPFNISGWVATTRIVAAGLPNDLGTVGERWTSLDLAGRRAVAARRVAAWKAANGGKLVLTLALPPGPGSDILFDGLARQYAQIGVTLERARADQSPDLRLRDRVARYGSALWFLNQFNCKVTSGICSQDVDFLVELAIDARDPTEQASYLAEAEEALAATNAYIPIGAPIRWSLVRADVDGFAENPWNMHPLFPMSRAPI